MTWIEEQSQKHNEQIINMRIEHVDAALAYSKMNAEEKEAHSRKCFQAMIATMNDGASIGGKK